MTKEEAKDLLDNLLGMAEDNQDNDYDKALKMGIESLRKEPSEDCISREAVLREIDKYMCGVPFNEKGIDVVLKELPHVTPTQKWIPVKERLPETDGEYLLFGKVDEFDEGHYKFIGEFDAATEKFGNLGEYFDGKKLFYKYEEVLAWMPLPDDYKEGKESE